MTKNDFRKLFDSVLDGRNGFSLEFMGGMYVHVYTEDNIFTACFITRVVEMTRDRFLGITLDKDGRPYMLFNL